MRRGNPLITNALDLSKSKADSGVMTVGGTVVKSFILMAIVAVSFLYSYTITGIESPNGVLTVAGIVALIAAIATSFNPKIAKYTAVIYAAAEGFALGALSNVVNKIYPGIAAQAVLVTIVVALATLLIYRAVPTLAQKVRKIVFIGLISIMAIYLISAIMQMFGVLLPFNGNGGIGIGFSIVVIIIAALSLMTDFDNISKGAAYGMPKYMEWYCAFGLTVTLIWLYAEILQLLLKANSRD